MYKQRIAAFFNIQPGEGHMVSLIFALYFFMILATSLMRLDAAQPINNGDFKVYQLSVSSDQQRFAISGRTELAIGADEWTDNIDIYDASTLSILYTISVNPSPVLLLSLNYDGTQVAYSTRYGNIIIYDLEAGSANQIISDYPDINNLSWSPVENKLAAAMGTSIFIFENGIQSIVIQNPSPIGRISSIEWSSNGQTIASTEYRSDTKAKVLQFWDLSTSENFLDIPSLSITDAGGSFLSWDVTDQMIASKEGDGLHIYDAGTGNEIAYLAQENSVIDGSGPIEWIPDTTLIIGADNAGIYQWNYVNGDVERVLASSPVTQIVWTPNGIINNGGNRGPYIDSKALVDIVSTPTPINTETSTLSPTNTSS